MTSVLLQPGVDGLDSIHLSKLLDWTPIAQAGYPWCSVYIGGDYAVVRAAIEAAWRAGIVLNPNFERLPDAAKRGYSEGNRHANIAVQQLLDLGFLGEAPVIFSGSDTGFTDDELPAAMEYHRAIVDVLTRIGWIGGAYGLRKVMEKLAQQPWWPSDWPIWHWGGDGYFVYWWAWVKQWYNRKPIGMPAPYDERHDISGIPFAIDENTLFKPMRFWSGYGPDEPTPTTEEEVVFRYAPENGWVIELANGYGTWVSGDYFYGAVQGQLRGDGKVSPTNVYAEPVPFAQLAKIPAPPSPGTAVVDIPAIAQAVRAEFTKTPPRW